ncbi:hypothetical protein GGR51DRAFT_566817 [Nemania sp. FL0031]|nr:hypothetical protein GGR51DRAFT_566817 [Nemania sp. FL0031]
MANSREVELAGRWTDASIQLTGFVKTIKMTALAFGSLGPDGEAFFKQRATSMSIQSAEFVHDDSEKNRIYFGNPADIAQETNGSIYWAAGTRLLSLRPSYDHRLTLSNSTNYSGVNTNNINNPSSLYIGGSPNANMAFYVDRCLTENLTQPNSGGNYRDQNDIHSQQSFSVPRVDLARPQRQQAQLLPVAPEGVVNQS